jgi:ketosteroid isomerase-like protein
MQIDSGAAGGIPSARRRGAREEGEAMSKTGRAIVEEYWKKLGSGDMQGSMAMLSPDVTYVMTGKTPISGTFRGMAEAVEKLMKPVFSKIQDLKLVPDEFIGEGDRVAVLAHGHARTSDGGTYENQYVFVYGVRDGKIVAVAEYLDTVEVETKMFGKKII